MIDVYDVSNNKWQTLQLTEAKEGVAVAASGNKVFFAGGLKNGYTAPDVIDVYDTATGNWSVIKLSIPGGFLAAASAIDKVIFT